MKLLLTAALSLLPLAAHAQIEVTEGFSRATLRNAPVAAGYLTIRSDQDDSLIAAHADFASEVQFHEMSHSNDIMRMRRIDGAIPIPANTDVALSTGGNHLMFVGLEHGLTEGETVNVTLTFEQAGDVTVPLLVKSPGARSFDDDGSPAAIPTEAGGHSH